MVRAFLKQEPLNPVALFAYNRPKHFAKTLKSLSKNHCASHTILKIYIDGPKPSKLESDASRIREVIQIANKYQNRFKSVEIIQRPSNVGLAQNITSGVSEVLRKFPSVIVVEDDLILHRQFLLFMNLALSKYRDDKRIFHVSAHSDEYARRQQFDVFLWKKMDCWGWGTWNDRWKIHEIEQTYHKQPIPDQRRWEFDLEGIFDFTYQIDENLRGNLNTWAVFWYQTIFNNNGLCLNTRIGFVKNRGLDGSGTHRVVGIDLGQKSFLFPRRLILPSHVPITKVREIPNSVFRKFFYQIYTAVRRNGGKRKNLEL